jgi:pimeloyl-ACP methyl ester carboxylesterase
MGTTRVRYEVRGTGQDVVVLLHGLNGTAAVWEPVDEVLARIWTGRRVLVDLPGHGGSEWLDCYALGIVAAAVATALREFDEPVNILGHSMGGVVGVALASDWFGLPVRRVVGLGIKTVWSSEELERAASARDRRPRWLKSRAEAEQAYLRSAGIASEGATEALLRQGVTDGPDGYRVTTDPRAPSLAGPWMQQVFGAAQAPIHLVRGAADPMVDLGALLPFDSRVEEIAGAGHNAHLEQPEAVARLIAVGKNDPA